MKDLGGCDLCDHRRAKWVARVVLLALQVRRRNVFAGKKPWGKNSRKWGRRYIAQVLLPRHSQEGLSFVEQLDHEEREYNEKWRAKPEDLP